MDTIFLMSIVIAVFYYHGYREVNSATENLMRNISSDVNGLKDSYLAESLQKTSGENEVNRQSIDEDQVGSVTETSTGCYSDGNGLCSNESIVTDKIDFITSTISSNLENDRLSDSKTETTTLAVTLKDDISTSQVIDAYNETSDDDDVAADVIRGSATVSVVNNVTVAGKPTDSTTHFTNVTTTVDVTTEISFHFKYSSGKDYCDCDLFKNECDINCCCDQDCTVKDKLSFVGCFPIRSANAIKSSDDYSDRFCYSTRFIFNSDKTVSRIVERNKNGLFCIAIDNLPTGILYENIFPIKSIDEFDRKLKSSKRGFFSWSQTQIFKRVDHAIVGVPFPINVTEYRYGDYIWTFTNYSDSYLRPLLVPSPSAWDPSLPFFSSVLSFTERQCHRSRPIRYLKDDSYSCLRPMPKSKDDCETAFKYIDANYYFDKNLRILTTPQTVLNDTSIFDYCSDETCVAIILSVCKDSNFLLCLDEVVVPGPKFYKSLGKCSNVVKNVRYLFHLDGVQNITKIEINIHLVNLSLPIMKSSFFRQHFEIKFYRSIHNKSQGMRIPLKVPLEKSGTPGYAIGKPIITGKKADLLSGIERQNYSSQYIVLNSDKKYWLSLPLVASASGGVCDNFARHNIAFLENIKSECLLRVPLRCDSSRDKTREILFGDYYSINVTDKKGPNIYISSYGDPDPTDPVGWVPVLSRKITGRSKSRGLLHGRDRCDEVFTDVEIEILYSYAGAVDRPQAKIVGALMSLRFDDSAVIQIGNDFEIFRMTGAVKFVDISKPDDAVIKFADPPVYEIKLPQDFFYPFLSSSLKVTPCFCCIIASVFLTSYLKFFGSYTL